jgi:hypothetical protein
MTMMTMTTQTTNREKLLEELSALDSTAPL